MIPVAIVFVGLWMVLLVWVIYEERRANARLEKDQAKLIMVLHQHERNAEIYQRNEAAYKSKIQGLEHEINLRRDVPSGKPPSKQDAELRLAVPPDGKEAFSPVLESGRVYEITIEGTCELVETGWCATRGIVGHADAFYRTDERGAFTPGHEWLHIDNERFDELVRERRAAKWHEDREAHRYTVRIKGMGQKVGISIRPAHYDKLSGAAPSDLKFSVAMLPKGTPLPKEITSTRRNRGASGMEKKSNASVQGYRIQQRQRAIAKAQEERDRKREIAADQTEDELAEMKIVFERHQKIVQSFQAEVSSIEESLTIDKEAKDQLVSALRGVLAKTLNPPPKEEEQSSEEPHVL